MSAPSVTLRPLESGDSDRLLTWRNLPEIARWMYSDHAITPDEHARWLAGALADARRRYWIVETDGTPVGLANLYDLAPEHGRTSWAYYLAEPSTRGQGIGAFVEYWVIEYVFRELRLNKLWCEVLIGNEAVWRLHEGFGFRREALFREHVIKDGAPADVVGLGLLKADWAAARAASRVRLVGRGFDLPA
ncbi:MAG TPA: UDP-4-amino-4,6-dideoxy-N-acetyl-beta-L-altrosamine N-acetyltransferase [Phenylobacterium sp.]|jgi:UDP-4-amino-4,6-dideoxy-N-acetyl-beta-L-altrosamine N-acetyltransferase|uniref:UDP-4-amino-4, 6-dideoxy-N-acetyl-beta-L-altrosamine N-acetyltransferase n=1 Tax=Phenylobacterium sp. TaxID=1871053 RepID=UPI002D66AAEE|nr:UDP-4-amino-4,6-dideoxy-N-acetyl-beta-L-altrosamine N-acetyltransferase [Phenylobacterium sp.]HZZ66868.1 UDP-4-amino-4,6-dideoxy-N-acetyl-beta-L-altrosamine N-acetyltransferase [Phenylobacterium sp.]